MTLPKSLPVKINNYYIITIAIRYWNDSYKHILITYFHQKLTTNLKVFFFLLRLFGTIQNVIYLC